MGIKMEGAEIFALPAKDGLGKTIALIRLNMLKVEGFKFIVLLCGKADLTESDHYFRESLVFSTCLK